MCVCVSTITGGTRGTVSDGSDAPLANGGRQSRKTKTVMAAAAAAAEAERRKGPRRLLGVFLMFVGGGVLHEIIHWYGHTLLTHTHAHKHTHTDTDLRSCACKTLGSSTRCLLMAHPTVAMVRSRPCSAEVCMLDPCAFSRLQAGQWQIFRWLAVAQLLLNTGTNTLSLVKSRSAICAHLCDHT